jgi:hypothetical protein
MFTHRNIIINIKQKTGKPEIFDRKTMQWNLKKKKEKKRPKKKKKEKEKKKNATGKNLGAEHCLYM